MKNLEWERQMMDNNKINNGSRTEGYADFISNLYINIEERKKYKNAVLAV